MSIYTAIACGGWIVVGLVWLSGSFTAKPTAARPDRARQAVAQAFLVAGSLLIFYSSAYGHFPAARLGRFFHSAAGRILAARITTASDGFGSCHG